VKFGSFYQKSVNIGEFEDIGRFQILALKIGEFTEKSVDLASLVGIQIISWYSFFGSFGQQGC
jgi:hypothetical protein